MGACLTTPGSRKPSLLLAATKPLRFAPTLTTPKPRVFVRTFANTNFGNAVLLASRAELPRFSAVHSTMHHGVNRLDVLGPTARGVMTGVVDMLSCRPPERLMDEPMNAPRPPSDFHKSIAVAVLGPGPSPALSVYVNVLV